MKNKSYKIISVLISAILFISIMPFNIIFGDSSDATYVTVESNECIPIFENLSTHSQRMYKANVETRAICIKNAGTNNGYIYTVSLTAGDFDANNDNSCPASLNTHMNRVYTYENNNFYIGVNDLNISLSSFDSLVPIVEIANTSSSTRPTLAYRYTYGDMAIDPTPPGPNYGLLKIGFTSSYAYSGGNSNAWRNNKDTIYFDRFDTLGNDLKGLNIELQAVPYTTEAASKQNLLGQKFNEFFYDTVRVGSLGFYSPGQNPVDFTWEYITNRFSPTWWSTYGDNWSLTGWYLTDHWYKVGWCYRARVVDDEMNTIIDWQTIYNGTSIDAQDTDNIINNNGYSPELVNSINEVNNFNNTTNNNYYNNQTINYNDGTLTSDGSWIEEFIRGIFETLGDIVTAIIGFGSDIINGLFDLVSNLGVNLISFFRDLIDTLTGADEQIDLTLPEWDPLIDEDGVLNEFKALGNGYVNMFVNSGLGYMLIIPLIIILLRLVF